MRCSITIIAATLTALWTCGNVWGVPPDVSYDWPTPADGATVTEPTVQVKAVITEADLVETTFGWAGADYTIYDSSLALMFNFNNVEGLGENYNGDPPSSFIDLSGFGNDGQWVAPVGVRPWIESAGFQGAIEFSGTQSILVMHNANGSLDPGAGDFAIALWILPQENVDADIIRKGSTNTTVGYDMWYKLEHSLNGDNKISLSFNTNGTDATIYSTDSYADYNWHFVVAQRKGDQAELWIDGVLNGTAAVTGQIYNEANLALGSKDTLDDDFYNGMLDEVRIYMRSFSADEVQLLYDSMLSKYKSTSGPVEWTLEVKRDGLESGDYTYAVSAENGSGETASNQRTVTIALPAPPEVTLVSPPDGSVLNNPAVTFSVDAVDPAGLSEATLYVGTPEQIATFSGPAETDDAQITADNPDAPYGGGVSINVDGLNPHAHAVIKFPNLVGSGPGQVPSNTTVASATLQLNCTNYGAMMQVYRLTSDWSEDTVTWNSPWASPGGDYDAAVVVNGDCTATGLRTIDVTEFVQMWVDGTPNYGILLTDTGTDGIDFDSSEGANPPVLTVVYAGDWLPAQIQPMSGTSDTATFTDIVLEDMTDYVWNCLVTNAADPPMSSLALDNFNLSIDSQTPDEPVLVGPADGATGVPMPVTLEVTVSDPQAEDVLDVTFYGRKKVSAADQFEIVVIPDTQNYCEFEANAHIFTVQTQWIVDNIGARNIAFVTHEGDIVENPGSTTEWDRAKASMSVLDPGLADLSDSGLPDPFVPYGVCPGNHDIPTGPPPSGYYNEYFPYTHYEGRSLAWYGGHYPSTGNDNSYQLFSAGGMDFVVVHLEYNPGSSISDPVIAWADGVLKAYADRFAIITTHAYIDTSANLIAEGAGIWNVLVQGNDNVHLVLCGHKHGEARRTDTVNGRQVHQVLADYQSRANGGDGWLRTMRFVPAENKIYVETYSPYRDEYETDADSKFELDVPLNGFTKIGTNLDAANGSNSSLEWPDLEEASEYEWYVTVTDSTSRTNVGPTWSFTTGLPVRASNPNPADGATQLATDVVLSWTAGMSAAWHDVYFGEDHAAVAGADISTPDIYQGRQDLGSETFAPAGLVGNQTYYWRIDEVEADGATIHTGAVWSFTTLNEAPVAVDDPHYVVDEDGLLVVDVLADGVLANDTDAEGQPLTAILQNDVASGSLSLNPDGTFTYAPDADFHGTDTFTYKASDGTSQSASAATVTITVNPINDAPTAGDDAYNMTEDTVLSVPAPGVLGNDNDVDGDAIVAVLVADVLHGSLLLNQDGSFSYSPSQGYVGQDTFQYEASDGLLASNVATVTITISEVDDPPTAIDDQYSMDQDTVLSVPAPGVLDNDTDPENGPLTAILAGDVSSGTLVLNDDGSFTYTPDAGYYGIDSFTYTANDGTSNSNEATVTITVNQVIDYDAYVVQDPTVTYGVLTGGIEGTNEAGDGLVQEIAEAPNGTAGMASLQAEYLLNTPAAPGEVTELTLYLNAAWTGYDADDPLVVSIFDGGVWQDITADVADGSFTPAASPGDYIDAEGNIRVRFTDTAPVRKEKKDTLTIDLLFAHVAAEPVEGHDVAVTAIIAPGSVLLGEQVTVDVTVENQGTFDETFDVELTDGGSPIDSRTVSLAPGASTVAGFTWDTTAASLGDHTLTATAGPVAEETNTTDNSMSKVVTVQEPITDIAVTTVSVPANVVQGSVVEVQVTVANAGNQDVGSLITVSLADTPDAGGSAGVVSGPQTVAGLGAGASTTLTFTWDTAAASLGAHTLSAGHDFADDNAVNDSASEISTVTQAGSTMHVESIDMSLVPTGKNTKATATILIHDNSETPLAGATVTGDWYLNGSLIQTAATGTTDGSGFVVITSAPEKAKSGDTFTFRVTDVALSGHTYEPGDNVETEDSIAVP